MNYKFVWMIVGIMAVIVIFVMFFFNRQDPDNGTLPAPTNTLDTTSPTPLSINEPTSDWVSYSSPDQNFSIKYPPDIKVQVNQDNSVSLIKLGPTQTQGTELFDGFNLTISSGTYSPTHFENFKGFVESEREVKRNDPVTQSISEIETLSLAGNEAFQFKHQAMGDFTLIYLPTKSNDYLLISKIVVDPGNLGFAEIVNKILSSLTH